MGYTVRDMADELLLPHTTYHGYESGYRPCPDYILCIAKDAHKRVQNFSKRYMPGGEFDQLLQSEYPCGIRSEL